MDTIIAQLLTLVPSNTLAYVIAIISAMAALMAVTPKPDAAATTWYGKTWFYFRTYLFDPLALNILNAKNAPKA